MAGNGNGEEHTLFKYMERVEKRFDKVEHELQGLRGEFRRFGKQVAKIFAAHRKRADELERRLAALERRAA